MDRIDSNSDLENQGISNRLPNVYRLPFYYRLPWKLILFFLCFFVFLYWLVNFPENNTIQFVTLFRIKSDISLFNYNFTIGPFSLASVFTLGPFHFQWNTIHIDSIIGYPFLLVQIWNLIFLLKIQILALGTVLLVFMYVLPKIPYLAFLKQKSLSFGLGLLVFFLFIAIFANFLAPYRYDYQNIDCLHNYYCRLAPPSAKHIMGTTTLGYDLYSRILYGAIVPFQMSIIAALLSCAIGIPLGLIGGYYGGTVDRVLNAIMDLLYSFPSILLAITLSLFLINIPYVGKDQVLRFIIVVGFSVGLVYIPTFFKIVRGQVFQVKEMAYVEAPRAMGASDYVIQARYILPNVLAAPLSLIPFPMVDAILTGAALAFLGLGIQPPAADWGADLTDGRNLVLNAPWWITFPGIMIFLLAFAFAIIGDALNDKFNPLISLEESSGMK